MKQYTVFVRKFQIARSAFGLHFITFDYMKTSQPRNGLQRKRAKRELRVALV